MKNLYLLALLPLTLLISDYSSAQYCAAATSNVAITPTTTNQVTAAYSSGKRAFNFAATAGCQYYFETCALTTADTYLRLYSTGTGGTVLATGDDNCGTQSSITWTCATSGTYSILVTNWSCANLTASTSLRYRINSCTAPYNPCTSITTINCGTANSFTVASGNGAYNPPTTTCGFSTPGQERIFQFTPTITGNYTISQPTSFGYIDWFYKAASGGCTGTGWTCIDDISGANVGNLNVNIPLTAGTTYYLLADPEGTTGGAVTFTLNCAAAAPTPPANDACAGATSLPCGTSGLAGTTVNAVSETAPLGYTSSFGVWYSFVGDGQQTTITANAAWDHEIVVFSGTGCGGTYTYVANADGTFSGNETVTFTTVNGTTYYVFVAHYLAGSTTTGAFTISRTCAPAPTPPANDACASATNLPCGTSNMAGTTVNAVSETAPSACGSSFGVWYTFTGDGQQTTISSTAVFDHEMTIVSGACGAFTNIACVDNSIGAESYTFTTTNGVVYRIYISHYLGGSTTTGTFTISRTCAPAPTPGGCNNTSAYGTANAPFNSTVTISSCQYGGEYATLNNVTAATQYTSSTDMAGAYFTIRQGSPAGSIVGEGLAPLNWTSTVAGTYYIHFNTNNFCGTDFLCHTNVISHTCPAVAAPTAASASPSAICVGNSLNLNASAAGNNINWFTTAVGGTAIGTSASGANYAISPSASTTYYAEAVVASSGCPSATRVAVNVLVNTPSLQTVPAAGDVVWNGRSSTDYATINNWYQFNGTGYLNATGAPTTAQNVIIPVNQTCVLNQPNTNANTVSANNITIENSASLTMTTGTLNVAGNFVNNGTFTAGSGTVAFVGTGNNTIGGAVVSNAFNNLTMNKAGEVLLDKPITIANTLALTNGRLNIAGFNLDMAANTVTGGSGSSYVKTSSTGEFKRNVGGSAVLFPVGRGAYNPATLTNSGTADNYGIRVVDNVADNGNNADAGPTTGLPVVNRTWMIDEAITGGSNVTLKLVWNGAGEGINGFDPIANTPFIAHYESGAGMWDNMGGNVVAVGAIEQSGFTSFSPFTISTSGTFAPLPIELVSFQANCADNNRVNVTWSTASEHNTSYFIIEKSRDGQNWKELATVPAAGNSTELLNYSVMDTEASDGLNYYRMTQFDNDGENEMFDPTTSNCSEEPQTVVKTYPNPSDESFFFMINTEEITGEGTLTITDAKGTVVFMQSVVVEKGNSVFHINDFQVLPGVYFVQVSNGTTSKVIMHSIR